MVHMYHYVGRLWPLAAFPASPLYYAFPSVSCFFSISVNSYLLRARELFIDTEYSLIQ